jgi:hypothetical protein
MIQGLGFGVQGLKFRVQDIRSGFRTGLKGQTSIGGA